MMSALVVGAFILPASHLPDAPLAFPAHPATPVASAPLHNDGEPPDSPEREPGVPFVASEYSVTGVPGPADLPQWKSLTERA